MPRFKLTIEYAGTRYSGWQIQKNAKTIQGEIDRAVRTVTKRRDFELYGSGRTDAGVHATGQVAHLDVSTPLAAAALVSRLNDKLPSDINIVDAAVVPHRFHARHHAVARRYVYQIARRRTAFHKTTVWWVKDPLDVDRMEREAKSNRQVYESLLAREKELSVASNSRANNVRVIDRAEVPRAPLSAGGRRTWLMSLAVGLILAVGVAFGLDYMKRTRSSGLRIDARGS